jgi:hypothetical protein
MPLIFLIAVEQDPSLICCYKQGDRVYIECEEGEQVTLPVRATQCNDADSTFMLNHLDHFVQQDDFYQRCIEDDIRVPGGAMATRLKPPTTESISGWWYVAGAAALAVVGFGVYSYLQQPAKMSTWDKWNPFYKPKTRGEALKQKVVDYRPSNITKNIVGTAVESARFVIQAPDMNNTMTFNTFNHSMGQLMHALNQNNGKPYIKTGGWGYSP